MTDVILSSLKSSSLQNSVNAVSETHPFVYQLGESTVPVAQETVKISPNSSVDPAGGQLVSFKLPGSGFLVDGYLRLDNTVTAAADENTTAGTPQAGGIFSYEYLTLASRDVEIARYSPILLEAESCKGKDTKLNQFAINSNQVSTSLAALAAAGTRELLCPFRLLNFASAPKDALDLQFLESLYLNAKVKPATDIAKGNASSTVSDLHAVLKYAKMPAESYQEYLNANYDQNKSLTKMMWSSYVESVQTVTGVSGAGVKNFTMNIDCPNYAVSTVVKVVPQTCSDAEKWKLCGGLSAGASIQDVKFSANGKLIVDTHNDVRGHFLGLQQNDFDSDETRVRNWTTSATTSWILPARQGFFEIDYRMLNLGKESKSIDSLEGGISMGALSSKNMQISWYHDADFDGDYKIHVVHKVVNLVSIDARNGSVSVSTRS